MDAATNTDISTNTDLNVDTNADTIVYRARRVITMNRAQPFAEAVAVRDGRVLAVGTVAELESWGPCTVDDRFADKVITPGFV